MRALVPPGRWPENRGGPAGPTLPDVWAGQWAARPDAPVLVDGSDRSQVVTAATLDGRTAALASVLADRGVRPGDRVVWCARATLPSVAALVAVLRRGAVLVPLSPSATAAEIAHVVGDARPVLAIAEGVRPRRIRCGTAGRARSRSWPVRPPPAVRRRRPRAAARRRRADRLHVGHDGAPEGGCAHPCLPAGRRLVAARGVGVGSRGPPRPVPPALPRARSVRRPVRHADRGRLRRRVRPLRRGGRPRRRAGEHHVLRRPDHVSPAGRVGSGVRTRRAPPLRLGVGGARPPTCGTGWPTTAWPSWSATA